ncbi:MAG: RRXRR domain-containing protein [Candidatus Lokiarchaeia archaeon]
MPTTPAKARKLMRGKQAIGRRSRLGGFYIQMLRPVGHKVQELSLACDPGSKFDGYAVASERRTNVKGMGILPKDIAKKIINRRQLRRVRRYRKTRRRPCRFNNRRRKNGWIAPSQKAKVDFKLKIIRELCRLYPIANIIMEDVRFNHYRKRWGKFFSTVEIGKDYLYREVKKLANLIKVDGWETSEARKKYDIRKTSDKEALTPESHANDAIVMLSKHYGRNIDSPTPFFVWNAYNPVRRQLHKQNPRKGDVRPAYGGTSGKHGIRKGDFIEAAVKGEKIQGWACSFSNTQIGIANFLGKRFAIPTVKNVRLIHRAAGVLHSEFLPTLTHGVSLGGI